MKEANTLIVLIRKLEAKSENSFSPPKNKNCTEACETKCVGKETDMSESMKEEHINFFSSWWKSYFVWLTQIQNLQEMTFS